MTSEQLYLIDQGQMEINFERLPSLLVLKLLKDPFNEQNCCKQKVNILRTSV